MNDNSYYMNKALKLAKKGLFTTTANPCVGCIIVNDNKVVGAGYHQVVGGLHAEIIALKQAGNKANGATAYVTLEPCSHFGKNAPCADALMTSGINKVVICNVDPNPLVSGKGIAKLKASGIEVVENVYTKKGNKLNKGFFHRMKTGLSQVVAPKNTTIKKMNYWRGRCGVMALSVEKLATINAFTNINNQSLPKKYRNLPNNFSTQQPMVVILDNELKMAYLPNIIKQIKRYSGRCIIMTSTQNQAEINQLVQQGIEIKTIPQINNLNHPYILKWLANQQFNEVFIPHR